MMKRQYQCQYIARFLWRHAGAGMIEVLISLLVLAIGLLGVLSLQANGLNSNQRAVFVTEAQLLAQDMADRILAFGSTGSNINGIEIGNRYSGTNTQDNSYPDPGCSNGGCDSDSTLQFDQYEWRQSIINSSLPSAYGIVSWDDPVYTIQILWDQDRTGATGTDCESTNKETNLTCFSMEVRI